MNIGIYGHSMALYQGKDPNNYIAKLKKHFNATIVHSGVPQCSEERILFELKKTKDLDFAVIFHTPPYNIFVPSWNRDISSVDRDTFNKKIKIEEWVKEIGIFDNSTQVKEFSKHLESIPNGALYQFLEHLDIDIEQHLEDIEQWSTGNDTLLKKVIIEKAKQFGEETFFEEMYNALDLQKKYLSHPDLQMNRYYGAVIQIDQYLKSKKIPCVHFLDKESWYPKWIDFTSGPYDTEIQKLQKQAGPYYVGYEKSENGLSVEANNIIFNRIVELYAASSIEANASKDHLEEGGSIPPAAPDRNTNG